MDVISLGLANKNLKTESTIRNSVLGVGVEGAFNSVKERVDSLEDVFKNAYKTANELILLDAINLMKANARLNVIERSIKYGMKNMFFDDLLDASGLDLIESEGYVLDEIEGSVACNVQHLAGIVENKTISIITTLTEPTDLIPTKAILTVEEENKVIKKHSPIMLGKEEPLPYLVEESSTILQKAYGGWRALDGDKNTAWVTSSGNTTGDITLDIGERKIVNSYTIHSHDSSEVVTEAMLPKTWTFMGSNDKMNWTQLDMQIDQQNWTKNEVRGFEFENNTSYQFYKIEILQNNGSSSYLALPEISLFLYDKKSNNNKIEYYISRNDGAEWERIVPDTVFYFDKQLVGQAKIKLKMKFPAGTKLLNYGLTWD